MAPVVDPLCGVGKKGSFPADEFYIPEFHHSLTRRNQRYNDRVIAGLGRLIYFELAFESGLLSENIAISNVRIAIVLITQVASLC